MLALEKVTCPVLETKTDTSTIKTTLLELVEAIRDEISPMEEKFIPEIVSHIMADRHAQCVGHLKGFNARIV